MYQILVSKYRVISFIDLREEEEDGHINYWKKLFTDLTDTLLQKMTSMFCFDNSDETINMIAGLKNSISQDWVEDLIT